MKKLWYLLLLPLFMGLAACSEEDIKDMKSLVGLWEMTNVKGVLTEDGKTESFDVSPRDNPAEFDRVDVADFTRWEFKSNGTFVGYEFENNAWEKYAEVIYSVNGGKLHLIGLGERENYTIVSLDETTLVVHFEESEGDEGSEDYYHLTMEATYKKIQ